MSKRSERLKAEKEPETPKPEEQSTEVEKETVETTEENPTEEKPADVAPSGDEMEFDTIISGSDFKDWAEGEQLLCTYTGEKATRKKQGKEPHQTPGSVMGYIVKDKNGNEVILGGAYSIEEAFKEAQKGDVFRITFLGKEPLEGGRTFNKFTIEKARRKS